MADMLESTPEGRAMGAAKQAIPLIEEGQAFMDESLGAVTPTGTYSAPRLASVAKLINKFAGIVEAPISVPTEFEAVKNAPMPMDLVKGLMGIKSAVEAFAAAMPEEVGDLEIPEISELVSDADVALAVAQIGKVIDGKEFQRFLRTEEPTVAVGVEVQVEEPPAEEPEPEDEGADTDEELAIMEMM
jgi:hypothetical protein